MTSNFIMAAKILERGGTIEYEGNKYAMDEEGYICLLMKNQNDKEIPIRIDFDVHNLKSMADKIDKTELWLKCCEAVIHEY